MTRPLLWLALVTTAACGHMSPASNDAAPLSDATADGATALDAAPPPPPRLVVSHDQILDPSGNPIILRGYNWGEWGTELETDAADNVSDGANSVRLPLRWWGNYKPGVDSRDDSQTATAGIDSGHLAALDTDIQWATDHKLWTVVFVDSNYGQGATSMTGSDNFWTDPDAKARFVEVWKCLAQLYRNTPYIAAYEILPEPRPPGVSDADVKAFYDSIIPVIRAIDPNTPIVVGPNNAYDLKHLDAAHTTIDPNIIYTGDYFIFSDPLDRMTDISSFITTFDAPVWINQVGIPSGDPNSVASSQMVLGALNNMSVGFAWWTYRTLSTNPATHGIYYSTDSGGWILKPYTNADGSTSTWRALIASYL